MRDNFTDTVESAAAYERHRGQRDDAWDDRPSLAEVADWPDDEDEGNCGSCGGVPCRDRCRE